MPRCDLMQPQRCAGFMGGAENAGAMGQRRSAEIRLDGSRFQARTLADWVRHWHGIE